MLVDKQVEVCFKIGKYENVVVCDVVPMEACHLLLGRPWQFDRGVQHDGRSNKYSFMHFEKKIILAPLSPNDVREDQKKMKEKYPQEKEKYAHWPNVVPLKFESGIPRVHPWKDLLATGAQATWFYLSFFS